MDNNTIEHHKIKYGSKVLPFQLEYRKRKTLEISVYPDMSVRVKAPLKRTYCEIEKKVRKRAVGASELSRGRVNRERRSQTPRRCPASGRITAIVDQHR